MSTKTWYDRIKEAREGADAEDIANWYKEADSAKNPYIYRKVPQELVSFFLYVSEKIEEFTASQSLRSELTNFTIDILAQSNKKQYTRVYETLIYLIYFTFDEYYPIKENLEAMMELSKKTNTLTSDEKLLFANFESRKDKLSPEEAAKYAEFQTKKNVLTATEKEEYAKREGEIKAYQTEKQLLLNGPIQFKIAEYMSKLDDLQDKLFPDYIKIYQDILNFDTVFTSACSYISPAEEGGVNDDFFSAIYNKVFKNLEVVKKDKDVQINMDDYFQKLMVLYANNETNPYPLRLGNEGEKISWSDILLKTLPNYARYFSENNDGITILDVNTLASFRDYIVSQPDPSVRFIMTSVFVNQLKIVKGKLMNIENTVDFYDYFHVLKHNDKQLFPTQKFRRDFTRTDAPFNLFTEEQYDVLGTCAFREGINFSSFLNIIREKVTKEDIVDALHGLAPVCKTELIAAGLVPSAEITINLKDTSEEFIKQQQKRLMDAIKGGNLEEFNKVAGSLKLDFTDENGDTPIHLAIELDKQNMIPYLLPLVGLSDKDKNGDTPFLHAIKKGNVAVVKMFSSLGNRAAWQIKDKEGKTARQIIEAMPESPARKDMLDAMALLERTSGDIELFNLSRNKSAEPMVNRPASDENITSTEANKNLPIGTLGVKGGPTGTPTSLRAVITKQREPLPPQLSSPNEPNDENYLSGMLSELGGLVLNVTGLRNVATELKAGGGNRTRTQRKRYAQTRKLSHKL